MIQNRKIAVKVAVTKISSNEIELTINPKTDVNVRHQYGRGATIGELRRTSDEFFEKLGDKDSWEGEVEIDRPVTDGEYSISNPEL